MSYSFNPISSQLRKRNQRPLGNRRQRNILPSASQDLLGSSDNDIKKQYGHNHSGSDLNDRSIQDNDKKDSHAFIQGSVGPSPNKKGLLRQIREEGANIPKQLVEDPLCKASNHDQGYHIQHISIIQNAKLQEKDVEGDVQSLNLLDRSFNTSVIVYKNNNTARPNQAFEEELASIKLKQNTTSVGAKEVSLHFKNSFEDIKSLNKRWGVLTSLGALDYSESKISNTDEENINNSSHPDRGLHFLQKSQFKDAMSRFKKAIELDGKDESSRHILEWLLFEEQEEVHEAISMLKEASMLQPNNTNIYFNLAIIYRSQRDLKKAQKYLRKILQIDAKYAKAYDLFGMIYQETGNLPSAIQMFCEAIKIDNKLYGASCDLGVAYLNMKEYQKAEVMFREAIILDPTKEIARYQLAVALLYQFKVYESILEFGNYFQSNQRDIKSNCNLNGTSFFLIKYNEAKSYLYELIDPYKQNHRAEGALLMLLLTEGDIENAEQHCPQVEKYGVKFYQFLQEVLNYEKKLHGTQSKLVEDSLLKGDNLSIENFYLSRFYCFWGVDLALQNKMDEALLKFQEAVKINPQNWIALREWGKILIMKREYNDALIKLIEASNLAPDNSQINYLWGQVLFYQGEFDHALTKTNLSLAIDPENAEAILLHADIFLKQSIPQQATKYYFRGVGLSQEKDSEKRRLILLLLADGSAQEAEEYASEMSDFNSAFNLKFYGFFVHVMKSVDWLDKAELILIKRLTIYESISSRMKLALVLLNISKGICQESAERIQKFVNSYDMWSGLALFEWGKILVEKNDYENALLSLRNAASLMDTTHNRDYYTVSQSKELDLIYARIVVFPRIELFTLRGKVLLMLNRAGEAIDEFQKVIEKIKKLERYFGHEMDLCDKKRTVLCEFGKALLVKEDYKKLTEKFQEVDAISLHDSELNYLWGRALFNLNEIDSAYLRIKEALHNDSEYIAAIVLYAKILWHQKKYQEAQSHYEKLLNKDPDNEEVNEDIICFLKELKEQGQYGIAEKYLKDRLYIQNNDEDNLDFLPSIFEESLPTDKLFATEESPELKQDASWNLNSSLLTQQIEQEKIEKSQLSLLEKSFTDESDRISTFFLERTPKSEAIYHFKYGQFLNIQGKVSEAISNYERAIRLDPENLEFCQTFIELMTQQGEDLVGLEKLALMNPQNWILLFYWGKYLFEQKNYEEAISKFEKASKLAPDSSESSELYFYAGLALFQQEDYETATHKFRQAIHLNPQDWRFHYHCGRALFNNKRYEDAALRFEQVFKLGHEDSGTYFFWSQALFEQGEVEEAIPKLEKAKALKLKK